MSFHIDKDFGAYLRERPPLKAALAVTLATVALVAAKTQGDSLLNYLHPSPEEILSRAEKAYAETGATPDDCYPAVMEAGGVLGDLIAEIKENPETDINEVHGVSDAGRDISNVLRAQHKIYDSDHQDIVQVGDHYLYCVLDDGEVVLGDPSAYQIIRR